MTIVNNVSSKVLAERMIEANQYKDKVLSSVTHDLKTPLNCIYLMTHHIAQIEDIREIHKLTDVIKTNCNMLLLLIHDILDYSQILKSEIRLVREKFSLRKLLKEVEDLFKIQFQEKQIQFIV